MSFYRDYNDKLAFERWNGRAPRSFRSFDLKPISPALGAEVSGLDLTQEFTPEQADDLRQALAENLVLVFRGQPIRTEDQKRVARLFGTLHRHALATNTAAMSAQSQDPEILSWKTGRESRFTAGDGWHNDVSCDAHPIFASFLRVTRLPEIGGGDTAFANLYLAYESLSDPIQRLLDGLTAVHDGAQAWTAGYGAKPQAGREFPATEHPIVARHPVTGLRFLYVNSGFTTHIPQLTRPESDALLQLLFRHIERNLAFQTRVHWSPDTLLVWDNWATQHHAVWDYYPFERWGERVSAYRDHGPQAA